MFVKLSHHVQPTRMPVTLDNCPGNFSAQVAARNASFVAVSQGQYDVFGLSRLSSYWSNLFSTLVAILLGLAISACTGTANSYKYRLHMTSDIFVRLWRKLKLIQYEPDMVS
ncbi:unnamed protein product, partial [Ixodes hexagonus]